MGVYQEDCRLLRNKFNKTWLEFQENFIKAQACLRERQQTACQGVYGAHNSILIQEAFANLAYAIGEYRARVINLMAANTNLS